MDPIQRTVKNDAALAALTQKHYQVVAIGPRPKDLQSLASLQSNRIMALEQIGKDLATFGQEFEAPLEPLFRKVSLQH